MGLTKEEAEKLLGLPGDPPPFLLRQRYKKLAHRYYPERNPHRKEYALMKFQKVVEAYVRLQIDPDDCDQMKIKTILMEIYSFHDDIAGDDESLFSDDSEGADVGIPPSSTSCSSSMSPFDATSGPYSNLLQDFTLRSYMSGRKSKSSGTSHKKSYVSEEARRQASRHAEELLKDVEEEKRKDDVRRLKNKKKKDAKKKRKDKILKRSSSKNMAKKCNSNERKNSDKQDEDDSSSSSDESGLNMDSAFFSRVTSKVPSSSALVLNNSDDDNSTTVSDEEEEEPENDNSVNTVLQELAAAATTSTSMLGRTKEAVNDRPNTTEQHQHLPDNKPSSSSKSSGRYSYNYHHNELPPRLQRKLAASKQQQQSGGGSIRKKTRTYSRRSDYSSSKKEVPELRTSRQTVAEKLFTVKEPQQIDNEPLVEESPMERSRRSAVQGNKAAKEGRFEDAVRSFTEAIKFYPNDERYFGNRSFCYEYLQEYERALEDGDSAIGLKRDWPKGHFRRGKALVGLGRYKEAESSLQKAVQLDPNYHDAADELKKVMEYLYSEVHVKSQEVAESTRINYYEMSSSSSNNAMSQSLSNSAQEYSETSNLVYVENDDDTNDEASGFETGYNENNQLSAGTSQSLISLPSVESSSPSSDNHSKPHENDQLPLLENSLSKLKIDHDGGTTRELSTTQDSSGKKDIVSEDIGTNDDDDVMIVVESNEDKKENIANANETSALYDEFLKAEKRKVSDTLWIGNVDPARIDEKMLFNTFKSCGRILKVCLLDSRFCAFIRFDTSESAAKGLRTYKGFCLAGCHLAIRYPDHPLEPQKAKTLVHQQKRKPLSVRKECQYWRASGCYYGASCRYLHIKKNKGADLKKRNP